MKIFSRKKSKKKILYKSYLEIKESEKRLAKEKVEVVNEPQEKVEVFKESELKVNDKKYKFNGTQTIAVCSICKKAGSTHVSKTIAYYIKKKVNASVCIVNFNNHELEVEVPVHNVNILADLYSKYDYIILDIGHNYNHVEAKRANIKIMMCLNEEQYNQELANFIFSNELSRSWFYIYNFVPKNKQSEIWALMENYDCYCLPIYDCKESGSEVNGIIKKMLKGK